MNIGKTLNSNKKGAGAPIAIGILIILIFVLLTVAYEKFYFRIQQTSILIENSDLLETVYSQESKVNFQIQQIVDSSAIGTSSSINDKAKFIENMKKELEKYKVQDNYIIPELGQLPERLTENRVITDNGQISIKLRIKIENSLQNEGFTYVSAQYIYEKEFIAQQS